MPLAARRSPNHWELVSGIWPKSSSVPTATISTRTGHDFLAGVVVLPPGVDRQHGGQPDGDEGEGGVMPGERQNGKSNGPVLYEGLPLGQSTGRYGDAVTRRPGAVDAHADLAQGDDDGRDN